MIGATKDVLRCTGYVISNGSMPTASTSQILDAMNALSQLRAIFTTVELLPVNLFQQINI